MKIIVSASSILRVFTAIMLCLPLFLGADWPLYRGDPEATGRVPLSEPVMAAPEVKEGLSRPNELRIVWQKTLEKGFFEASPIVVGDTVYVGSADDYFYAFDLENGDERWKYPVEDGVLATASYWKGETGDGIVSFGDTAGVLHALDAKSGEKRWTFKTKGNIRTAPNVYKNRLLVGSEDNSLYCLDAADGKELWKYTTKDMIQSFATVATDSADSGKTGKVRGFVAGCDGQLHVVDCESGRGIAQVELESPTGSTPAVLGDHVFLGTEGNEFLAIDWKKHVISWRFPSKQAFRAPAAVMPGMVVCGGYDRKVYALDPASGKELWRFSSRKTIDGGPVVFGDRVFVVSNDATVSLLDRRDGRKIASLELDGGIKASPAVVGNSLLVGTLEGVLYRIAF